MDGRSPSRSDHSSVQRRQEQQSQLPFTGSNVLDDEIAGPGLPPTSPRPARNTLKQIRSSSMSSGVLSSSYNQRFPVRSFLHQTTHGSHEPVQYSSEGVREQTQQLASWTIGSLHSSSPSIPPGHPASESDVPVRAGGTEAWSDLDSSERRVSIDSQTIEEVTEPESPDDHVSAPGPSSSSSLLSRMMNRSPSQEDIPRISAESTRSAQSGRHSTKDGIGAGPDDAESGEFTPLLPKHSASDSASKHSYGSTQGLIQPWRRDIAAWEGVKARSKAVFSTLAHPKRWNRRAIFENVVLEPVSTLPAVFLGWLLNILDALSYGMILFPLGNEVFADTGPDGISMFFVSCIVSQLVYSFGGSIFKGAVGSEMIEVVPFFHKMTEMIMRRMEGADPTAIRATTITSYAISSILTGLIFFALGLFKLGGVGIFLFLTGIEVSARMDSGMEYSLSTLEKLFAPDTVMLWVTPLFLAIVLIIIRRFFNHPVVLPAYFISVTVLFYIVVTAVPWLDLDKLRDAGWVFEKPSSGKPFYNFYSYYDFRIVDWGALASTIPTMFALSFFGIIHVPINVPALGLAVREDDVDANRELIAHGISNTLSGCVGSIQNYLVYANSIMFYENGGDTRLAGILLAVATTLTWFAGPGAIGYIPVMIVGILIYLLGIDLIKESLWDTAGKVHRLEFFIILAIAVVMGLYDFVVGIVAGIVLACLLYVLQSSKVSAIRATYTGSIAESTVRRHPVQRKFLRQVGSQILVVKLAGYLFFGTIVAVENKARDIVDEEAFKHQPIKYLILDFAHVDGIDFSAAEGFSRMHRILGRRDVRMCLSSVSKSGELGSSLTMVGLLDEENVDDALPPPKVYEDLNRALEACENELLLAFKRRGETHDDANEAHSKGAVHALPLPAASAPAKNASLIDTMHSSPRRNFVQQAVQTTLNEYDISSLNKFNHFKQPLPLILQSFYQLTDKDIDFWQRAVPYFSRRELPKGTILYSRGDEPDGFYIVEAGMLRADYDLEQGHYYESIVAGTSCGELPFFSDCERSATVVAEVDCVVWLLTREKWNKLEKEWPEGGRELLKVGFKLTSERMNAVTSFVLVMAS